MGIASSRKTICGTRRAIKKVMNGSINIWNNNLKKKNTPIDLHRPIAEGFYSDSDSESDNDERERKIHVEIKPLNNGTAPISASVDELRATVETLSLSPLGGALSVWKQFPIIFEYIR